MQKLRSLFQPAPSRPGYADAADFLRVVSVGLVGWYHIWQQSWQNPNIRIFGWTLRIEPLIGCGYLFVDLMLMLSGFLLMLGLLNGRGRRTGEFYFSRAARIAPSYYFCILVMLVIALIQGSYAAWGELLADLLPHLGFVHNLFRASYSATKLNGALWTLAVEVQFYLFFPLLGRAFERWPLKTYFLMTAVAFAFRGWLIGLVDDTALLVNRLPALLDAYANGMLAAYLLHGLHRRGKESVRGAWLSTLIALAACALIVHICFLQRGRSGQEGIRLGQMLYRWPLTALGAVFLICGSRAVRGLRLLLSNAPLRFLSGISYNFYIWHQTICVWLKRAHIPAYTVENPNQAGIQPWKNQFTLISMGAALLAAILLTYLLERPCARLLKRWRARRRQDGTEPVSPLRPE